MSDLYLLTQSPKSYGRVVLALFVVGVTVNDLLNARGVYLILVLKGGRLIGTWCLLEGDVYFLSKVTHSNHYRNKLTALLNSNNFHTTFAEALIQRGR